MIDGQNAFDESVKNELRTYDNIREIATGQGDVYTIGCQLDYPYFKKYCKMIQQILEKQALDADAKTIQINFTGNLDRPDNTVQYFSLLKKRKKAFQIFPKEL